MEREEPTTPRAPSCEVPDKGGWSAPGPEKRPVCPCRERLPAISSGGGRPRGGNTHRGRTWPVHTQSGQTGIGSPWGPREPHRLTMTGQQHGASTARSPNPKPVHLGPVLQGEGLLSFPAHGGPSCSKRGPGRTLHPQEGQERRPCGRLPRVRVGVQTATLPRPCHQHQSRTRALHTGVSMACHSRPDPERWGVPGPRGLPAATLKLSGASLAPLPSVFSAALGGPVVTSNRQMPWKGSDTPWSSCTPAPSLPPRPAPHNGPLLVCRARHRSNLEKQTGT